MASSVRSAVAGALGNLPQNSLAVGPQPGPQAMMVACPANEILYGGARGGGKTYGTLLKWLAHYFRHPRHAKGLVLRKTLADLEDMINESKALFPMFGAEYREGRKTWVLPGGATVRFRYLEREKDAENYQGHSYTFIAVDEAGQFASAKTIDTLKGTLRSSHGVPVVLMLTANPGGVGHNWLKRRFVDPAPPFRIQEVVEEGTIWRRVYIPAKMGDNRILMDSDPGYRARVVQAAGARLRSAWLDGDWNVAAGGMFDDLWTPERHIIDPFPIPSNWPIYRCFDWGSSVPFAALWIAHTNGEEVRAPDGRQYHFPRHSRVIVREYYGTPPDGEPNEGVKMLAGDVGRKIKQIEADAPWGRQVLPGAADAAIFNTDNGVCIASDLAGAGANFIPSVKGKGSRVNGWELMRGFLGAALRSPYEKPVMVVFKGCVHTIRTVPSLPRDPTNPDDVDTNAEDHCGDVLRYDLLTPIRGPMQVARVTGT